MQKSELRHFLGYALFMAISLLLIAPIFIAPFLAQSDAQLFHSIISVYGPPVCHQLASRSYCYFQNGAIGDCDQHNVTVVGRQEIVDDHGVLGYKFPVCARDLGIYGSIILSGLLFPFIRKIDDREAPPFIYFMLALVPIAIDGGTQLLGFRESTNTLRVVTGFIAGILVPFYMIPILNMFVLGREDVGVGKVKKSP